MATGARDRLLTTAEDLFYAEGIRAVGLERLLTTADVGRASFYRHFASKDELVVAVLRARDRAWREWLRERVTAHGGHPLAIFDALEERFGRADFRGCAFINTIVETADPDSPAHRVAAEHKQAVTAYVEELLALHGIRNASTVAMQLVLLIDGAIVTALRQGSPEPARQARAIAELLLTATD